MPLTESLVVPERLRRIADVFTSISKVAMAAMLLAALLTLMAAGAVARAAEPTAEPADDAAVTQAAPPPVAADAVAKPAEKPDTPAQAQDRPGVPVRVVHSGSDALGARLALALKEAFAASPLFAPTGQDTPQIRLLLSTREEFGGRPGLGSVFAITWVYSENEGTLKYHLATEVGFADAQSLRDVARELAARTAEKAEQYAYLLQ